MLWAQPVFSSMFAAAGDPGAVDAPPRKPKPFLKRGEGVDKRLNAYKLRDEAAELRKERSSGSSSNRGQRPATDDQVEAGSSLHSHAGQHRRTWQQPPRHKQPPKPAAGVEALVSPRPAAAAGKQGSSSAAAAAAAEHGSWAGGQNVEVGAPRELSSTASNQLCVQQAWPQPKLCYAVWQSCQHSSCIQCTRLACTKAPPVRAPLYVLPVEMYVDAPGCVYAVAL